VVLLKPAHAAPASRLRRRAAAGFKAARAAISYNSWKVTAEYMARLTCWCEDAQTQKRKSMRKRIVGESRRKRDARDHLRESSTLDLILLERIIRGHIKGRNEGRLSTDPILEAQTSAMVRFPRTSSMP
jgi:hypothetical protein